MRQTGIRDPGAVQVEHFQAVERFQPLERPVADFWTRFTPDNGYRFDYARQQDTWFSGMPGLWVQDAACQSGVMPICDRTQENLSANDTGIAATRRLLLNSLAAYRDRGIRPPGADDPETFMVRAVSLHLPADVAWAEAGSPFMRAKLGADFGYAP